MTRAACLWGFLVLAGAAARPGIGAAVPAACQDNSGCQRCTFKGTLPCPKHPKGAAKEEEGVLDCSIAARCATCRGTFRTDCQDCAGSAAELELQAARETKEAFAAGQAEFEKEMGGEPRARVRTAHFDLTFEVEQLTVGRAQLGQHELLHLYAKRLEALYADFNEILGLRPADHRSPPYRVFIWRNPLDQRDAAGRYAQGGSGKGVKLLGAKGVFTMVRDRNEHPKDDDLMRTVVHNVTHLLLADLFDAVWLGNRKAGWVDEGLAHWFEDRAYGQCTNFCYQEQNTLVAFKGGKWRAPVRSMVESDKLPGFAETSQKQSDQLTLAEHALAFSYVDFCLARDAKAFPKLVRELQKKKPTRDALAAYGLGMAEFESEWRKWVLSTYVKR